MAARPSPPSRSDAVPGESPVPGGGAIRVAVLRDGRLVERESWDGLEAELARPGAAAWIDVVAPSPVQIAEITRRLGLHPLIAEDILEGNQRSKVEVTDSRIHIVVFSLAYRGEIEMTEIDIVLGPGFLLTIHGADWDPRRTAHVRAGLEPILARGPDHLLWAALDAIVDDYFPLLDRLGDEIDELQDTVISEPTPATLNRLFRLKRDLIVVRRAAGPLREIFNQLTNRELALIDAEEILYFRDVYDHLIRLTDELDSYRELVSGTLDVYLSTINNNLSAIMKRLTGITVILAGVGAIGGLFGMSEAGAAVAGTEAAGFYLVVLASAAAAAAVAIVLRRIEWI